MKKNSLRIAELRVILLSILDHIENDLNIHELDVDKDFYWALSSDDKYQMGVEPSEFLVGQLYDDLEFLLPVLRDKSLATPLMFMHLAPLLEYFATEINWFEINKVGGDK